MNDIFNVVASEIMVMLVFIIIGWLLRRFGILKDGTGRIMGNLLVWVFIPATVIKSLSANFTVSNLSEKLSILVAGIVVVAICFVIAIPLGKILGTSDYSKKIYSYSFVIPNTSYVGIPLMMAVFGEEKCCDMVVFTIPFMLVMYTWGMYVLTRQEKISLKTINNPVVYSIVIGIVLGLTGIQIPKIPATILTNAGNCIAPCAMILAGNVVASKPLKSLFGCGKAYIASIIRLVGIPLIIAVPMILLGIDKNITFISVISTAMPMGLNAIIFPEAVGQDSSEGAGMVVISTILCIITVPIITMLLMNL